MIVFKIANLRNERASPNDKMFYCRLKWNLGKNYKVK